MESGLKETHAVVTRYNHKHINIKLIIIKSKRERTQTKIVFDGSPNIL